MACTEPALAGPVVGLLLALVTTHKNKSSERDDDGVLRAAALVQTSLAPASFVVWQTSELCVCARECLSEGFTVGLSSLLYIF